MAGCSAHWLPRAKGCVARSHLSSTCAPQDRAVSHAPSWLMRAGEQNQKRLAGRFWESKLTERCAHWCALRDPAHAARLTIARYLPRAANDARRWLATRGAASLAHNRWLTTGAWLTLAMLRRA